MVARAQVPSRPPALVDESALGAHSPLQLPPLLPSLYVGRIVYYMTYNFQNMSIICSNSREVTSCLYRPFVFDRPFARVYGEGDGEGARGGEIDIFCVRISFE